MNFEYSEKEKVFRDDVKKWLKETLPSTLSEKVKKYQRLNREDYEIFMKNLNDRGWLAWHWPTEYGGTGWSAIEKHIFEEEIINASAPRIVPFGVNMLGPVLIEFGTEEQKKYYLPRILNNEDWWAQGYSEPGAGSDLASLKTRAIDHGDHYIVNGQKTWTTLGQYANKIFCLVKTDINSKPQSGISFLLIDMDTPGIEVKPIVTLDGEHEVNEVWFTDVKVPKKNLVGKENEGWTCAKYLLTFERTGIAGVPYSKSALNLLKIISKKSFKNGKPLIEDPVFSSEIAELEIDLLAMEIFNLRIVSQASEGKAPGMESSLLKIKGTLVRQRTTELLRKALGPQALPYLPEQFDEGWNDMPIGPDYAGPIAKQYFNMRKISIYGGSNEIQKNIVAKASFGL
ncbi:MAG: acyl-CoA dehydrogenase family protein [Proteobacteria bacterium]|nr:acyl-CoA dehydrogenase family protein [Pseudomonadota bacterium]MDA1135182.1 acyl-CoA dehydrogenase family protein [Pseudomonadota bacterium]